MNRQVSRFRAIAAVATAILVLVACGKQSAEKHVAAAREQLAKKNNRAAIIELKNALQKEPDRAATRLLLGQALLEEGDARSAEVELRKAQELGSPAVELAPLLMRAYVATGQFKRVLDEAPKAQVGAPEAAASIDTSLANALAVTGDLEGAGKALARALEKKPDYVPASIAQARLSAGARKFDEALATIEQVLKQDAGNFEAWKMRGDLMGARGDVDEATASYRKAIALRSDLLVARSAIASILLRQRKLDDATKEVDEMKRISKGHPLTLSAATQVAFAKGDFKAARESSQQLLRITPDSALALTQGGAIEFRLKAYPQAEALLVKALRQAPASLAASRWLALSYLGSGQPGRAVEVLQPILDKNPDLGDANLLSLAGEAYLRNGDPARAEQLLAKASKLDPDDARKQTNLAVTHLAKGDADAGFAELERIAASDTGTSADMALIAGHLRRGEFDKALRVIDGLEKKLPDSPVPHELRGRVLLSKRDAAGARKSFERALALNPTHLPATAGLAALDMLDKKPADAAKRFESLLAADPKNVRGWLGLAGLKMQSGAGTEEVAGVIGKAIAAQPDDPEPRRALVELYLRAKDARKALSVAQEGIAAVPNNAEIHAALGQAQLANNDYNQALASFAKQAALQPGSPLPYLRMAEVNTAAQKPEAAQQNLRQALQVKPDLIEAQRGLIGLDIRLNKGQNALGIAREVQKQRPREAIGYVLEGDIQAFKKAWKEAIASFGTALKLQPGQEVAIKLHSALEASGDKAEAGRFAAGWTRDHAKDYAFQMHLGEIAIARNDMEGASQRFRNLLAVMPENPVLLNNLAWVAGRQKAADALGFAEKANKIAPNQPAFMDTLGMLLAEKGDIARAVELLAKAVELAPQAYGIKLNQARVLIKSGKKPEARRILEDLAALGDKFPAQKEIEKLAEEL